MCVAVCALARPRAGDPALPDHSKTSATAEWTKPDTKVIMLTRLALSGVWGGFVTLCVVTTTACQLLHFQPKPTMTLPAHTRRHTRTLVRSKKYDADTLLTLHFPTLAHAGTM